MKEKKGIRRKILISTTLINLLLAGVLVAVMVYFMKDLTTTMLTDTLQPLAKTAAQNVENSLHVMLDRLQVIKENALNTEGEAADEYNRAVLDNVKAGIEFVWLALYNTDGTLYTGSEGSPASMADEALYAMMRQTQNPVIDDTAPGAGGIEIRMGTPVLGSDGNIVYYLIGSYKYDVLNDVLGNLNISANGEAFIINDEERYMAHRDAGFVTGRKRVTDSYAGDSGIAEIVANMMDGETGVAVTKSENGERYFAFSPVRGTHWSLAVTAPSEDFAAASNNAIFIAVMITLVMLLLSTLVTLQLAARIQRPIGRATRRIAAAAVGDLHTAVNVESTNDEIETLSQALSNTVTGINAYTSELSRVLNELSDSNLDVSVNGDFRGDFVEMKNSLNHIVDFLNQIMSSIQQASLKVATTSRVVMESASNVQRNSSGQSDSLANLNREAHSIAQNVEEVSDCTAQVSRLAEKAISALKVGDERMKNMMEAMRDISSKSEEITKITKMLEDVAFQTNILAINASVEAAHAGSAGKGFAVVADEVRSLANKSAQSAQKASGVIESSIDTIKQGEGYARQVEQSLREIIEVSDGINRISKELGTAVNVQKTSLSVITRRIDEVNTLAGNNLDTGMESVEASRSLAEEAETLKNMAERFRLKGRVPR